MILTDICPACSASPTVWQSISGRRYCASCAESFASFLKTGATRDGSGDSSPTIEVEVMVDE